MPPIHSGGYSSFNFNHFLARCGKQEEWVDWLDQILTFAYKAGGRVKANAYISRGHREDGRLGLVKNFKTPFFKRY